MPFNFDKVDPMVAFDWIKEFHTENARGPTVRELAAAMGCGLDTGQRLVVYLRDEGYLIPNPGGRPGFIIPVRRP